MEGKSLKIEIEEPSYEKRPILDNSEPVNGDKNGIGGLKVDEKDIDRPKFADK